MKKVFIKTIGCQMNKHDAQRMLEMMQKEGYTETDNPSEADLLILNTCSVRDKAEQKAISAVGRWKWNKRRRGAVIVMTGCVAQQYKEKLFEKANHLDIVIGPDQISKLPELVQKAQSKKRICEAEFTTEEDPMFLSNHPEIIRPSVATYVTIMKGCNEHCTFCIVPKVRGKSRFRPSEDIINEVKNLALNGVKEVTLLGQTVNSYNYENITFAQLLYSLGEIKEINRIRYTSPHPRFLNSEIIKAHKEIGSLCEYLHLPVQSGSNNILKKMGRRHTREEFIEKIDELKSLVPNIALGTDLIVGFPGETEKDFLDTIDLLKTVEFDNIFSFKYSPRPDTAAFKLEDDIPVEEKELRLEQLHQVQEEIQNKRMKAYEGKLVEVLVEGESIIGEGQYTGRTRTNYVVNYTMESSNQSDNTLKFLVSKLINVKILRAGKHSLEGIYIN